MNMSQPGSLPNASVAQDVPQTPRRKLNLLDIHPLKLAQQLSLLEHDLCKDVIISDLEARRALSEPRQQDSISPVIKFSNHLATWVMQNILEPEDAPGRATVMEYFISVAHNVLGMNNFSSMTAIIAGLFTPYVYRLNGTWKLVSKEKHNDMESCRKICKPNNGFVNSFMALACLEPPGVPFIGFNLMVRDETDAYYDALVLRGFARWQSTPYSFEVDEDIRAFIQEGLSQFAGSNGDDTDRFKKLSLNREPERKGEQEAFRKLLNGLQLEV